MWVVGAKHSLLDLNAPHVKVVRLIELALPGKCSKCGSAAGQCLLQYPTSERSTKRTATRGRPKQKYTGGPISPPTKAVYATIDYHGFELLANMNSNTRHGLSTYDNGCGEILPSLRAIPVPPRATPCCGGIWQHSGGRGRALSP